MKIGIIGAMEQEVALLQSQIENLHTDVVAGCEIYTGQLAGAEVVLMRSGIGKVAAAIATTILIERYAPDAVINTGSAGGFDPSLNVGDVVISSEVRYHDVDVTAFGYELGQVPRMPAAFLPHPTLVAVAQEVIAQMDHHKAKTGLITTGDIFMSDPAKVDATRAAFPAMIAVEMEAAAIAQTCHQFEVPFVITRALSDIAGKESPGSFESFLEKAATHSAELVIAMLAQLKDSELA
ncbi:5'-methylthioadenosine/S-adenosylhomocysteine nucleosidase [Gallaecimonas kandeliae]|uniref:5'-methylthioadenosine/S-adenosylhomocysteine nucleosidase n=1 Tax=Gallaecimonas kandeliae TaxID=3029055 RepID=UPI0026497CB7|nr:5'-methylthioadenosine/S-adenosylhomocysteine nucleosidase [Gallaecimonas kandeliae]WKE64832.1 5'-methylthioadenosine/S-adenosylhomocysteine nucleosidase [Gallaecimonas kandeliae]